MNEPSDWTERLRASGHRLTPQRKAVLEAVETLGHATPDQVYAEVRERGINLSTVYRTLELLDELGLIHHAHLSDRAPTYHAAGGHVHSHLVCRRCRAVLSVSGEDMAVALGPVVSPLGFAPDYGHLTVFGTCADCAERQEGLAAGSSADRRPSGASEARTARDGVRPGG